MICISEFMGDDDNDVADDDDDDDAAIVFLGVDCGWAVVGDVDTYDDSLMPWEGESDDDSSWLCATCVPRRLLLLLWLSNRWDTCNDDGGDSVDAVGMNGCCDIDIEVEAKFVLPQDPAYGLLLILLLLLPLVTDGDGLATRGVLLVGRLALTAVPMLLYGLL